MRIQITWKVGLLRNRKGGQWHETRSPLLFNIYTGVQNYIEDLVREAIQDVKDHADDNSMIARSYMYTYNGLQAMMDRLNTISN